MTNKNTTKKTRKARKNFPLIKFICIILFFVGVIIFVISVVTSYKTYTGSEIIKAKRRLCFIIRFIVSVSIS